MGGTISSHIVEGQELLNHQDCVVSIEGSDLPEVPGLNHVEPDWAVRESADTSILRPPKDIQFVRTWADFEQRRRIMSLYGFAKDQNLYVFVDAERRAARRVIVINGVFMVIIALFIILLVSGVIPFCNY